MALKNMFWTSMILIGPWNWQPDFIGSSTVYSTLLQQQLPKEPIETKNYSRPKL